MTDDTEVTTADLVATLDEMLQDHPEAVADEDDGYGRPVVVEWVLVAAVADLETHTSSVIALSPGDALDHRVVGLLDVARESML